MRDTHSPLRLGTAATDSLVPLPALAKAEKAH